MGSSSTPLTAKSFFDKLREGVLLSYFKQRCNEPELEAVSCMSAETARISKVSEYLEDIFRIKNEINLCLSLISYLPTDEFFHKHNTDAVNYILFHQGAILDLVHQMKDKLGQLCLGITTVGEFDEPERIRPKQLVKNVNIRQLVGLESEILKWDQDSKTGISIALKKRTQYHHFRNRLSLNQNISLIKLAKFISQPQFTEALTEYGKEDIAERGKRGMTDWHADVKQKISSTLSQINESVENICRILYTGVKMPTIEIDGPLIFDKYHKMRDSLLIKNAAKRDNIQKEFLPMVSFIEGQFRLFLSKSLASCYLIGSIGRGKALPRVSDFNFVVVVDSADVILLEGMRRGYALIVETTRIPLDIQICSIKEFAGPEKRKLRFICKSEGILLTGVDLIQDEEFPMPGLRLAKLLNSDAKSTAEYLDRLLDSIHDQNHRELRKLSVTTAKMALRIVFSAVMAQKAVYKVQWEEIKDAINELYPERKVMTDTAYDIIRNGGLFAKDTLHDLLDSIYKDGGLSNLINRIEEENLKLDNIRPK